MELYNSIIYKDDLHIALKNVVNLNQLNNHSVLITGVTGTIGSFLTDMLIQYNQQYHSNIIIYAAGRNLTQLTKKFDYAKMDNLIFVEYDMNKPLLFDFDVDYIIHAAGNAYPSSFAKDPVGTIIGNVNSTYALLEYGRHHKIKRFLYISSGEIYGLMDSSVSEFTEEDIGYVDIKNPRYCYPISKRTAENLCISYTKQYEIDTVIVRPCHTFGPGITPTDNRANVEFLKNVLSGEDIILKSEGKQFRSYSYVADCASSIFTVLLNGICGEIYNSANRKARCTIRELAEIIALESGHKVTYKISDKELLINQTPIKRQILSSKKIEALGWHAAFSVREGIQHTLKILQGN